MFERITSWFASALFGFIIGALGGVIWWSVGGSCTVGMPFEDFTCTAQQAITDSYPQVFECTEWSRK